MHEPLDSATKGMSLLKNLQPSRLDSESDTDKSKTQTPVTVSKEAAESARLAKIIPPAPEQFVVKYDTDLRLQKLLNAWSKHSLKVHAGIAVFLLLSWALHLYAALVVVPILCMILIGKTLLTAYRPNYVVFNRKGVALAWNNWFSRSITQFVSWDHVLQLTYLPGARPGDEGELCIKSNRSQFGSGMLSGLLSAGLCNGNEIKLKLSGIAVGDQRRNLMRAFQTHLKNSSVSKDVADLLNPIKPQSYTSLWLDSFSAAPKRTSEELLQPGITVGNGRYKVISQMGAGGQGTVYKSMRIADAEMTSAITEDGDCDGQHNISLNERADLVVLKEFILPSHAGRDLSARTLENIQREANLLEKLDNDQIVQLLDFFVEDHRAYLVLEHIDGPSLKRLVEDKGPLPEPQVRELALQMCDILEFLHGLEPPVVHRDFTPENLILDSSGKLKLIDFNVAQQLESTSTRTIVGKHCYIPPEQFRGKACNQSDIYSAGASLHFLLTGQEPEPISVSRPGELNVTVSPNLDAIVAKATDAELENRYRSAAELRSALLS